MTKKHNPNAGEFPDITKFINRMFTTSANIGKAVETIEQALPALTASVEAENHDIAVLVEALERLKTNNSKAQALTGKLMEENESLIDAKHTMRQLATISQLPPVLAQTSPEFIRDVLTTVDSAVLTKALGLIEVDTFEKLLNALNHK